MLLKKLDLWNFKAYSRFTLHFGTNGFLVGPNNAGKSTLIAATRASAGLLAHASRRRTTGAARHGAKRVRTHQIRSDGFGLVTENLRHQFRAVESSLSLRTDTDLRATAVWPHDGEDPGEAFFYLEHGDGRAIVEPKTVRSMVGQIGIIPGLSPINQTEHILDESYLSEHVEGRRSSQHTRNQLYQLTTTGSLDAFKEFAHEWLPEIEDLEVSTHRSLDLKEVEIDVFLREAGDRTPKELFWAGDGMQVFVQLLAHLYRLRDSDVVVLDEPDLYLHADLQRRLVRLLESTAAQTITATHSSEMLSEASPESVIWVDKSRRRGVRRPDPASMEDLSAQIGSSFNLRLATALRARVVVLVEGKDMSILRALAKTVGALDLAAEQNIAVVEIDGFSNWVHVEPFKWFVSEFLDDAVQAFVLLDRDYRSDEEVVSVSAQLETAGVRPHVWRSKELESYLLVPEAIARVSGASSAEVRAALELATSDLTDHVVGQLAARRHDFVKSSGQDLGTTVSQSMAELTPLSRDLAWRLVRYPAKEILKGANKELQASGHRTVGPKRLAKILRRNEIDDEMADWLMQVEEAVHRRPGT